MKELFGADHPETIFSKSNLAELLLAMGDEKGAQEVQTEIMSHFSETDGECEDHGDCESHGERENHGSKFPTRASSLPENKPKLG